MKKTKDEQAARVARVEKLLRGYAADVMRSNGAREDVDQYVAQCRDFVVMLSELEESVWK